MWNWHKDLEPVLHDQPMAKTIRSLETLGNNILDISDFATGSASHDHQPKDCDQLDGYEGWFPNPPPFIADENSVDE